MGNKSLQPESHLLEEAPVSSRRSSQGNSAIVSTNRRKEAKEDSYRGFNIKEKTLYETSEKFANIIRTYLQDIDLSASNQDNNYPETVKIYLKKENPLRARNLQNIDFIIGIVRNFLQQMAKDEEIGVKDLSEIIQAIKAVADESEISESDWQEIARGLNSAKQALTVFAKTLRGKTGIEKERRVNEYLLALKKCTLEQLRNNNALIEGDEFKLVYATAEDIDVKRLSRQQVISGIRQNTAKLIAEHHKLQSTIRDSREDLADAVSDGILDEVTDITPSPVHKDRLERIAGLLLETVEEIFQKTNK